MKYGFSVQKVMQYSQSYKASNTNGCDLEKWVRASLNYSLDGSSVSHVPVIELSLALKIWLKLGLCFFVLLSSFAV